MIKVIRWTHWGLVAFLLCAGLSTAQAQVCKPSQALTKTQAAVKYLRRLSFDLRGRAPSYGELDAVVKQGYVDDATIDAMLNSSLFVSEMREFHKDLLTINITDLRIGKANRTVTYRSVNAQGLLPKTGETRYIILDWASSAQRQISRGNPNAFCLNEPVKKNAQGEVLCKIQSTGKYITCDQAYYDINVGKKKITAQEGYTMISPFWEKDATKKVRVCGIPAQTAATGSYDYINTAGKAGKLEYDCATNHNILKQERDFHPSACGCGPRLNWCFRGGTGALGSNNTYKKSMHLEVLESYMEQTLRFIDTLTSKDRPYTDILTAKDADYNGPISHFVNYNTDTSRISLPSKTEFAAIKPLAYHSINTWRPYTRTSRDAGVLTLPFYLLKYANNRGRLHRFYNAFLCKHFTPPSGGLPAPDDKCHDDPNLMTRCGCKHCHTTVEPGAAFWGRWQESAWFPILTAAYKDYDAICAGKDGYKYLHCKSLYMYAPKHDKEKAYKGQLLARVFANATMQKSINQGPATLANVHIKSGEVASCSVNNMYRWFVGQDLQKDQSDLQTKLTNDFQNSGYRIKQLVRAIVTSVEYRRGFESNAP